MKEAHYHYATHPGVADGARTHDNRNHNPGLYQLSYSQHIETHCDNAFLYGRTYWI